MTLTLDDIRSKRFRMARKSGYEVLEVDEFVDAVEESFAQLVEENVSLRRQIDALRASAPAPAEPVAAASPASPPPVEAPTPEPVAEPQRIVVTTSHEASAAVVRLVEMSTEQAERLVEEAEADAGRIREDANREAQQVTSDARTRAERVESEARVNAERVQADANGRAEALDRELDSRRAELFGDLERERAELTDAVNALRSFELAYRSNLADHLRGQLAAVESAQAEPSDVPALLDAPRPGEERSPESGAGSNTPRLDALLGEQA